MVKLIADDIKTREVLDWKGMHVLHYWVHRVRRSSVFF